MLVLRNDVDQIVLINNNAEGDSLNNKCYDQNSFLELKQHLGSF